MVLIGKKRPLGLKSSARASHVLNSLGWRASSGVLILIDVHSTEEKPEMFVGSSYLLVVWLLKLQMKIAVLCGGKFKGCAYDKLCFTVKGSSAAFGPKSWVPSERTWWNNQRGSYGTGLFYIRQRNASDSYQVQLRQKWWLYWNILFITLLLTYLVCVASNFAEGYMMRMADFDTFERKFQECLSKSAVRTKFEQHTQQGIHIAQNMRTLLECVFDKANSLR